MVSGNSVTGKNYGNKSNTHIKNKGVKDPLSKYFSSYVYD